MNAPTTPAQTNFINSLLGQRIVPSDIKALAAKVATKADASKVIDTLKGLPFAPRGGVRQLSPEAAELQAVLANTPSSKFAIPTRYLRLAFPDLKTSGDLLFLEVRRYSGRKYFNRLSGAPGGFNRFRVGSVADQIALLKFIAGREVEFARTFGEHYGVCGKCAAELTDQVSRELGFGPTCAKAFGLA